MRIHRRLILTQLSATKPTEQTSRLQPIQKKPWCATPVTRKIRLKGPLFSREWMYCEPSLQGAKTRYFTMASSWISNKLLKNFLSIIAALKGNAVKEFLL